MLITQSFIFAAGRGERMRPLTDTLPKPLVPIKNKAIIDYSIEKLSKIPTMSKIIINGFYLADQIEDHIKKLNNSKIIFSREVAKIETGGGLVYALDKFDQTQPILLINGDILWQDGAASDIEQLCNAYNHNDCDILLGLKKTGEVLGYEGNGDFNFDKKTGELTRIFLQQNSAVENSSKANNDKALSHVFVGLQIVNPVILKNAPTPPFSMSYFYKKATEENGKLNRVKGFELQGRYFHIGEVKTIAEVEEALSL